MRAVVQRVSEASVSVEGRPVAAIGCGLLVLLGLHGDDSDKDMQYIINKILGLRIFDDDQGAMNLSVQNVNGEILVVSQFTLYGDARRGKRPSYSDAMAPERAEKVYADFMGSIKKEYHRVCEGIFGAHMQVSLVNSGPVTILLDSSKLF
jgi:D-tyrosyl-tRNA(Tyr) deacylase